MKLLQAGGIRFLLNPYFLILLAAASYTGHLLPTLLVFSFVMLHELGHVLMAQSFGLRVQEVELLPFGGVARIDGLLEADPFVEILVALAGPVTSLLLAGLAYYLLLIDALPRMWLELSLRSNLPLAFLICCRPCLWMGAVVAGPADQGHGLPGGHPPGGPAGESLGHHPRAHRRL